MSSLKSSKNAAPLLALLDCDLGGLSNEELLAQVEKLQEVSRNTQATKSAISNKTGKKTTKAKAVEINAKATNLLKELGL